MLPMPHPGEEIKAKMTLFRWSWVLLLGKFSDLKVKRHPLTCWEKLPRAKSKGTWVLGAALPLTIYYKLLILSILWKTFEAATSNSLCALDNALQFSGPQALYQSTWPDGACSKVTSDIQSLINYQHHQGGLYLPSNLEFNFHTHHFFHWPLQLS